MATHFADLPVWTGFKCVDYINVYTVILAQKIQIKERIMSRVAGLYSGQGAQYTGMGKELFDNFSYVREIYTCGSDILGYDLSKTSFFGDEAALSQTIHAQPAIFSLSMSAYTAAEKELGFNLDCVLGHSLGEYAALCCAGAYSLEDGFRIIKARSSAMDSVKNKSVAMYAIMGSSESAVKAACEQAGGKVWPVNFNQPSQTVISGEAEPAEKAADILAESGAKAVKLSVSGAFHTELMQDAADEFKAAISGLKFNGTSVPFYSNLTGGEYKIEDYPEYFARHMVSPVRFAEEIQNVAAAGIDTCVEFGPKRVAATLAKKNVKAMRVYGVEDISSLQKLRESLA